MKPFSTSAEENQRPILEVLRDVFPREAQILEIASGTGQHGVFFAGHLPHLQWQTTELEENLPGLRLWVQEAALPNLPPPFLLDMSRPRWPGTKVNGIFCANAVQIMGWPEVENLFRGLGALLAPGGAAVFYGPFHYNGHPTSEGNASFDQWLRERDPRSGVRDFEALNALAEAEGLRLESDFEMPVNNRTVIWRRPADGN